MSDSFSKKRVPYYWWDIDGNNSVIVESDIDKYPIIARFYFNPKDGTGCALPAVDKAEWLIKELKAGRKTIKQALEENQQ